MGIESQLTETKKLSVIDFHEEKLKPGTSSWLATCNDVRRALEDYGCFVALYDKVSLELQNSTFHGLEELFDLPKETKIKNTSNKPYHGYLDHQQHPFIPPLHESFGIENATSLDQVQSFTKLLWPTGNGLFCENVLAYATITSRLEQMVKRMVFESYGVEKYCESHIGLTAYLLRLIKYRVPNTNEADIGSEVHTDKSFITVLYQNEVNGLEVETKDGEWIRVDLSPSSFVVMAGDAFLAWSNNRIHSALHRVTMKGTKSRYSLALFAFHNGIVEVPQELVDKQHPLHFRSFDNYGLLHYYSCEDIENLTEPTSKAYCGV